MNKEYFLYNISNRGCQAGLVLTPVFLCLYREFLPKSSAIDYIELKTKLGGITKIMSMYKKDLTIFQTSVGAMFNLTTPDLYLLNSTDRKTLNNLGVIYLPIFR